AAAGVPYHSSKRTRLEYSTVAKTALNPQEFTEISIMHLLDNSIPKALKKACYGGSHTKIGCSWTQFSSNINAAIDYVELKIDNEYVSYQHDSRAKATYFMFYNKEGTQIITIPSTNSINIRMVVEVVNNAFTKNGIIYDFSAYKNKISGKFHTFGIKFLLKKTIVSFEIPAFLEINKFILVFTYRELSLEAQDQLAENSNILDELQKLATEQKSEQKNFKKKAGQCIESITNKKLVEISLDISDRAIVSEDSVGIIDMELVNKLAYNNGFTDAKCNKTILSEAT
ncbi:hypothetical protein BB561_001213, partial [Smittium simulii]